MLDFRLNCFPNYLSIWLIFSHFSIRITHLPFTVLPKIAPFDFGEEAMYAGETAQVACFITEGDHPMKISWTYNGEIDVNVLPGVSVVKAGRKGSNLVIDPTLSSHQGNYTCSARNAAGATNFTAVLFVNGNFSEPFRFPFPVLPRIAPFDFGEEAIFAGEAAQVSCFVTEGDLPVDISWVFNKADVSVLPGVSTPKAGRKGSSLVIDPTLAMHRGNYTCTARNRAGSTNFTATLNVNGSVIY